MENIFSRADCERTKAALFQAFINDENTTGCRVNVRQNILNLARQGVIKYTPTQIDNAIRYYDKELEKKKIEELWKQQREQIKN